MRRYIVPDTCVLAAALYNEIYTLQAELILEEIRQGTVDAVAPSLGMAEFLNVSRKKLDPRFTSPALSQAVVNTAVANFTTLPITWIDIEPYTAQAWHLHRDHKIETGDAFFVAIAMEFSAEIWTTDSQFTGSTRLVYANIYDLKASSWK